MTEAPVVGSVHALDTGAGDGFVADAAVFAELDCRASCIATSLLAPDPVPLELLARQLERASKLPPLAAMKVGFTGGPAHVEQIAHFVRRAAAAAAVVAPVLRAGAELIVDAPSQAAIARHLYPAARVVVVRVADLAELCGCDAADAGGMRDAAKRLRDRGARAVVVSGLVANGRVLDLLDDGGEVVLLDTARIQAPHVPGLAGCYAAAMAAHLARGLGLRDAVEAAQRYVGFRILRGR